MNVIIHSFNKDFLSTYCVRGTGFSTEMMMMMIVMKNTGMSCVIMEPKSMHRKAVQ